MRSSRSRIGTGLLFLLATAPSPSHAGKPKHPAHAPRKPLTPEDVGLPPAGSDTMPPGFDDAKPAAASTPTAAPPPQSPAPAPTAAPPAAPPPPVEPAKTDDLDALRAEYDALRDELFRSRARVAAVGEAAWKTRLVVEVAWLAQRDWPLDRVVVLLDEHEIYTSDAPSGVDADHPIHAYAGFAAAGRHAVSVRLTSSAAQGRAGFTAAGSFIIDVAEGRETRLRILADETGDGPKPIAAHREGRYDLRLRGQIDSKADNRNDARPTRTDPAKPDAARPGAK